MEYLEKILTERQYSIYRMHLEGFESKEIAESIGCSRQNVNQALSLSRKKIEKYDNLVSAGFLEEDAISKVRKKPGREKSILINYLGGCKALTEWCKEFGIKYSMAYARYKRGLPAEKIFEGPLRENKGFSDYGIKDEYDLSLIPDEYRYILEQKNAGKSFVKIAEELGCTSANVTKKARIAISQLNFQNNEYVEKTKPDYNRLKNDQNYLKYNVEKNKEFYRNHSEDEKMRRSGRRKSGGKLNSYQRKILEGLKIIETYLEIDDIEKSKDCLKSLIEDVKNDIRKTK